MKQALEDYIREVEERAERFAQQEDLTRRDDHLRSFNLGRMAQRVERSRHEIWLRVAWLMVGITIGIALGRAYPDYLYPALAHKFLTKAGVVVRSAGKTNFSSFWKNLRA